MRHRIIWFHLFSAAAFQKFRNCCWGIVILSFVSMEVTGCAPLKIPPFKAEPFDTYKNQVAKNDLHIAVWPMTDKDQQEKCFGAALADMGVLPVLIIAENRSASQRFMLRDDLILLQHKTTRQIFPQAFQTAPADDSQHEGARTASGALTATSLLVVPIASLPFVFLSLGLAKSSENAKAIQDSIFDKTLFTQTVLPGKTAEGFAYFKLADGKIDLSDGKINLNELLLSVQASDESAQSIQSFEFGL
jgi:hypothetical protein